MKTLAMTVNGRTISAPAEPRRHLADYLREDLLLTGTHLGCEQGVCGACTVIRDGRPVRSCLTFAVSCEGSGIQSIEGFDDDPLMARLRAAFSAEHALQCGFCTPGMLISARDIVQRFGAGGLDSAGIRTELSGNLCRCTGYNGIVRAIERVLREQQAAPVSPAQEPVALTATDFGSLASIPQASVGASSGQAATTSSRSDDAGQHIESTFTLAHSPQTVWSVIRHDIGVLVACLPGAELSQIHDDGRVEGHLQVRLGPISARMAGEGRVDYDDDARSGSVTGEGKDKRSNSRASGALSFSIRETPEGQTEMVTALSFRLTGALAQFSRGGLVEEIVRTLIEQFRGNFDARLSGKAVPATRSLGLVSLAMLAFRHWLRRLFSRS